MRDRFSLDKLVAVRAGITILTLAGVALLVDQMENASDCSAKERCDHVDPEVVINLCVRGIEAVDSPIAIIVENVGVRILAHSERDIAAGQGRVPATVAKQSCHLNNELLEQGETHDLKKAVVCQLSVFVLDRDKG